MIAPGTVVQWWDIPTGGRRLGTVASVRQSRRGPVYRLHEGDGSTAEPANYHASRYARGVLDFPADAIAPYVRRYWPDAPPEDAAEPEPSTPAPDLPPLVFVHVSDLDRSTGGGAAEAPRLF
jgi:hypothetical protein